MIGRASFIRENGRFMIVDSTGTTLRILREESKVYGWLHNANEGFFKKHWSLEKVRKRRYWSARRKKDYTG